MAFNPDPRVAVARRVANEAKKPMAIIILIDPQAGRMEYASYGSDAGLCRSAKILADVAYEAIFNVITERGMP